MSKIITLILNLLMFFGVMLLVGSFFGGAQLTQKEQLLIVGFALAVSVVDANLKGKRHREDVEEDK